MINSVIVEGYTTFDGSLFEKNDVKIYNNTIAIRDYTKKQVVTYFVKFKAFGKLALHLKENLNKGDFITINGKLTINSYTKDEVKYQETVISLISLTNHDFNKDKSSQNIDIDIDIEDLAELEALASEENDELQNINIDVNEDITEKINEIPNTIKSEESENELIHCADECDFDFDELGNTTDSNSNNELDNLSALFDDFLS